MEVVNQRERVSRRGWLTKQPKLIQLAEIGEWRSIREGEWRSVESVAPSS